MQIKGMEGLTDEEFAEQLKNGARFVYFEFCVSLLIVTFKQPTSIYFIRAGESAVMKGLPWTLLSWVVGWWGFPFGVIYTLWVTISNFSGGTNVTNDLTREMRPRSRFDGD